uniref:Uncharacterized protein n=1 Tax=Glossina austeni TaxID=7395 RepID=A0A1A9VQI0_GLOAU
MCYHSGIHVNHVEIDVTYNLCGNEKASSGHTFYYVYLRREHPLDQDTAFINIQVISLLPPLTCRMKKTPEKKTDLRGRVTTSLQPVEPVVEDWKTVVNADISCARISLFGKED